jgi:cobyrinic acid a,c-diamide synthase
MNQLETPRFILSGNKSACGKSIIAVGLCVSLRKRNISLSCCVNGSNPIQAMILKRLTRRYTRCLDANILSNSQILTSMQQAAMGADMMLIEGQDGLFDGVSPGSLKTSDAELAALTRTPVVLVVDSEGYYNSLAALIKGYYDFAQGFSIEGIIANNCDLSPLDGDDPGLNSSQKIRDKIFYDAVLQSFKMQALIGAVPKSPAPFPQITDKFTQLKGNISFPLQFFKDVGNLVENHVDVNGLIQLAGKAPGIRLPDKVFEPAQRRTRIAVSDDNCFSLSFQDNIELMRFYGAEIVGFSPLADEEIPKRVGAIYFTGAMLAGYEEELAKNQNIKNSIKQFVESGGVVYSEGAGTAFLCEEYEGADEGVFYEGIGLLKARAVKEQSFFGYHEAITIEDSILGRAGNVIKGVSIGEWKLEKAGLISKIFRISRGSNTFEEGYSPGAQIVSTFSFFHFASSPQIAKNIVDAAEIVAKV